MAKAKEFGLVHTWTIVAFGSFAQFLSMAFGLNLNIFVEQWKTTFDTSYEKVAVILSITMALMQGLSPIVALVLKRFGFRLSVMIAGFFASAAMFATAYAHEYWVLIVLIGIVYGSAQSFCLTGPTTIVGYLVPANRRHIAFSIIFTGTGIGLCVQPFLINYLIEEYTWRGALTIMSGITLNLVACGAILPRNADLGVESAADVDKKPLSERLDLHLWKEVPFLMLMVASFCTQFTGVGFGTFFFSLFVTQYEMTNTDASLVLTLMGAASILGRLSTSLIKPTRTVPRWWIWCLDVLLFAVTVILLGQCDTFAAAVALMLFFGFFVGVLFPLHAIIMTDLFDISLLPSVFGYNYFAVGAGSLVGPIVTGKLRDLTQSFNVPAGLCGGITVLVTTIGLMIWPIRCLCGRQSTRSITLDESPGTDDFISDNMLSGFSEHDDFLEIDADDVEIKK